MLYFGSVKAPPTDKFMNKRKSSSFKIPYFHYVNDVKTVDSIRCLMQHIECGMSNHIKLIHAKQSIEWMSYNLFIFGVGAVVVYFIFPISA
jgi:hypothetical protein